MKKFATKKEAIDNAKSWGFKVESQNATRVIFTNGSFLNPVHYVANEKNGKWTVTRV